MWRVKLDGRTVYEPDNTRLGATVAELSMRLSEPGALELQIPYEHALYSDLASMPLLANNWFTVERDGIEIWRGRLVQRTAKPLDGTMLLIIEGELGLFNDSVCPPYSVTETPAAYLARLVGYHNAQVDSWKRFYTGRVQVANVAGTGQITREVQAPADMMQELLGKTCNSSTGGYLVTRRENGKRYLDWISDPAKIGAQPIKTAYNLLSVEDDSDGGDFCTAVYATGAQVQGADDEYYTLTLEALADRTDQGTAKVGPLLINTDLKAVHGVIARVVSWDDVTDADNLYTRARQYVRSLSVPRAVTVKAVDMSLTGSGVAPFEIGQRVPLDTPTFEGSALITGVTYDLLDAGGGSVEFADISADTVDAGELVAVKTTGTAAQVASATQATQAQGAAIAKLQAQIASAGGSIALPLAVAQGGTGSTDAASARAALGVAYSSSTVNNWLVHYYPGGLIVATRTITGSLAATTSYGGRYISALQTQNLPSGVFSSVDYAQVSVFSSPGLWFAAQTSVTTSAIGFYVQASSSLTQSVTRKFIVVGR